MIIREVLAEEKEKFNQLVSHPLQTWEWGEFRQKTGVEVVRLGVFEATELKAGWQLTIHNLPYLPFKIIYFPKGPKPSQSMLVALKKLGQEKKAILIKLEPNLWTTEPEKTKEKFAPVETLLLKEGCRSGRPLFTPWTFLLDLTFSEEEILAKMKSKTRYNLRLAQRQGVKIIEDKSEKAFQAYLQLMSETTQRQGFYAHTPEYHRLLWETLAPTDLYHLLLAEYQGKILAAYVFFIFNQVLYYPYGASSRENSQLMSTYALFWEAIKMGKQKGCAAFDMWGSLGPDPDPKDPWYGFHRFKQGFGAPLIKFIAAYDLVINSRLYPLFTWGNNLRWQALRLRSRFGR